jgi:hypothetical protein
MSNKPRRPTDEELAQRRDLVMELRFGGHTIRSIAKALGVGVGTVHRDLAAVEAKFRQDAKIDVATEKGRDLARIERMLAGVFRAASAGEPKAVHAAVELIALRGKLTGEFEPEKISLQDLRERVPEVAQAYDLDPVAFATYVDQWLRRQSRG